MSVQKKLGDDKPEPFHLRVKIGEYEVELSGTHQDVTKTLQTLPDLITNVSKAFDAVRPKTVATITLKTSEQTTSNTKPSETATQNYPRIGAAQNTQETVLKLLESEWGKWRPRTVEELQEALQANDQKTDDQTLSVTLDELASKGLIRRWNTNTGYVYILAENKNPPEPGDKP
jgi:hypothetical protein